MSTWEAYFSERVAEARGDEVNMLRRKALLNGSVNSFLQITPKIALFATLVTFVLQGNKLDPETVRLRILTPYTLLRLRGSAS